MSCTTCKRASILPSCTSALVLGTITSLSAALHIFFQRKSTGRLLVLDDAASDADGLVTADLTGAEEFFQPGDTYEAWVVLASAANMYGRKTLTLSGTTAECLLLTFQKVQDQSYASQTIEIC